MFKLTFLFIYFLPALLFGADTIDATVLLFSEQGAEHGAEQESYQTRMLISEDFLRIDDGAGADGYVLFDRQNNIIYNINNDTKTVMTVELIPDEVKPPFDLDLVAEKITLPAGAPEINGIKPQHYRLSTNQEHCLDVIAVNGMLESAVNAMQAYNRVLASNNAITLDATPLELQTPCMLSMNIFYVNQNLRYGFPVQEWDKYGKRRSLISYKQNEKLESSLFNLANRFQHFSIKDFREGRVKIGE